MHEVRARARRQYALLIRHAQQPRRGRSRHLQGVAERRAEALTAKRTASCIVMAAPASVPSSSDRRSPARRTSAAAEVVTVGPPAAGGIASEISVSRDAPFSR